MVSKDVVKDGLEAIWAAIIDLIKQDVDINLNFGFCRIVIDDRNLKARFRSGFSGEIKNRDFEDKMKRSMSPCSTFWKTSYKSQWKNSMLGQTLRNTQTGFTKRQHKK
jgi:hypothetical protein